MKRSLLVKNTILGRDKTKLRPPKSAKSKRTWVRHLGQMQLTQVKRKTNPAGSQRVYH